MEAPQHLYHLRNGWQARKNFEATRFTNKNKTHMNEDSPDNLNLDTLDLTSTDTGFPVIPAGMYTATVRKVAYEPNKKGTGQNLKMELALTEPVADLTGRQLNPGWIIRDLVSLVVSRKEDGSVKYDPRQRLAEFQEGVLGKKLTSFNPLEQYLEQQVTIRVKVEDDPEFGKSNRVQRYIKKA
tara:strand:- start:492 stop:1040 length:549 start_codon:yes stop_codon:yes gene_type:complete